MTASDPRVGEIQAVQERLDMAQRLEFPAFMIPTIHVAYLLAELRDRDEKLAKVEALAEAVTLFEHALGLDLSDDDFDRGWHGRGREMADQIRAAVAAANGGG